MCKKPEWHIRQPHTEKHEIQRAYARLTLRSRSESLGPPRALFGHPDDPHPPHSTHHTVGISSLATTTSMTLLEIPFMNAWKSARSGGGLLLGTFMLLNLFGTQRVLQQHEGTTGSLRAHESVLREELPPAAPAAAAAAATINLKAYACPDVTDASLHDNYKIPLHQWKLPDANPEGVDLPRLDRFPTEPGEPVADYSYSRFAETFYLDSKQAIHLVVMSDRTGYFDPKWDPFPALVNSLLLHSSMPIVMHVVTRYPIPWLDALDSPFFQVNYYNYERLGFFGNAHRMQRSYNFQSSHKSMPMPMVKLFFTLLPLPTPPDYSTSRGIENLLLVDDDITFFNDPAKLWLQLNPHRLALNCPKDPRRIEKFYTSVNQTSNGHSERYCNSGMVNLPILPKRAHPKYGFTNDLMEMYFNATFQMTTEYPEAWYLTADQDIYNRILADNEELVDMIPCQWHCDYNSCKRGYDGHCSNCYDIGRSDDPEKRYCQTFHYVSGSYKFRKREIETQAARIAPPTAQIFDYTALWGLVPLQTLVEHFLPKVTAEMPGCRAR